MVLLKQSQAGAMRLTPEACRRTWSLSYLTASSLTPPQAVDVAAAAGYSHVGLRLFPSMPGGAYQDLLGDVTLMRETQAHMRDTGIELFDVEVIRLGEAFDASAWRGLLEAGAALKARAVLVVGDDQVPARLAHSFASLCALALPYGLQVELEFLPWTAVRGASDALAVVEDAGRPANAGILVDALHWARAGSSVVDLAALPPDLLHYMQVCDGPGSGTFTRDEMIHTAVTQRLLPGEGSIDLKTVLAVLPPNLPLSVEIPNHFRMSTLGAFEWARQALVASQTLVAHIPP